MFRLNVIIFVIMLNTGILTEVTHIFGKGKASIYRVL